MKHLERVKSENNQRLGTEKQTIKAHTRSHGHSHDQDAASTTPAVNPFAASVLPVATSTPGAATAQPLATAPIEAPSTIPKPPGTGAAAASSEGKNKVIVVFKNDTPAADIDAAINDVKSKGGVVTHRYDAALLGFAAEMPDASVSTLNSHPSVSYIEPDGEVSIYAKNLLSGNNK
ncbi:hypothetical protein FBU30_002635 [Linnemannia zychae]|nr:hypothetical protein FBU30_002635 [Linnemannia zychae]